MANLPAGERFEASRQDKLRPRSAVNQCEKFLRSILESGKRGFGKSGYSKRDQGSGWDEGVIEYAYPSNSFVGNPLTSTLATNIAPLRGLAASTFGSSPSLA